MPAEAARLLALVFDPEITTAEDAISARIFDAALSLAAASGFKHLTMEDVGRRAGVGRMTVYRRFGSKPALVDALAVRECRRCLATIAAAIPPEAAADERLTALFTATLTVIREHPLLARLATVEPEALLRELTRDGSAVFRLVRDFLIDLIRQSQEAGELAPADPAVLAELALRLGASFVLMPETALPLDDGGALRRLVGTIALGRTVA